MRYLLSQYSLRHRAENTLQRTCMFHHPQVSTQSSRVLSSRIPLPCGLLISPYVPLIQYLWQVCCVPAYNRQFVSMSHTLPLACLTHRLVRVLRYFGSAPRATRSQPKDDKTDQISIGRPVTVALPGLGPRCSLNTVQKVANVSAPRIAKQTRSKECL